MRVVEVLGSHIPIQIFKETQKIEREGGMMIINNRRRRTPGKLYLNIETFLYLFYFKAESFYFC